jgi:hypothetical protein
VRRGGLDGKDVQGRPGLLQHLRAAGDVAARAHAGDQRVELRGKVTQDLLRRGRDVEGDVGRVLELLRHPGEDRPFKRPFFVALRRRLGRQNRRSRF